MERWPTRNGVSLSLDEVGAPETRLDLDNPWHVDNHHWAWRARVFGATAIGTTFRNLGRHQSLEGLDRHNWVHRNYDPPEQPTQLQALDAIQDALENDEYLRLGSANRPTFIKLTPQLFNKVKATYEPRV